MHLPYKSPLLRTLSTLLFSPFLLLGSSRETSTATLHLLLNFLEKSASAADAIRFARITLGNAKVHTYSASLLIETHFQGLAYFMHKWWLTTAIVSILNIMLVEIMLVSLVWTLLTGEDNGEGDADDHVDRDNGVELLQSPGQRVKSSDEAYDDDDGDGGNVSREDNVEGESAIPLSSSKSDSQSSRENDDNDTLDGESITEHSFYHATTTNTTTGIIDAQVLTGMLQSGAPTSTFPINRTPRHHHLAQSGNFSYPYSRSSGISGISSSSSSSIPVVADTRRVPPAVVQLSRSMSPSLTPSSSASSSSSSSSLQNHLHPPPPASTVSDSAYSVTTTASAVVNRVDEDREATAMMDTTTITPDDFDLSTNSSTIHHEFGEDTTIPVLDEEEEEGVVDEFDMAGLLDKQDDLFL